MTRCPPELRGYSLVETIVALVLFAVGLLGVTGMSVLAARTMAEASVEQRSRGVLHSVADSVIDTGWTGAGQVLRDPFEVRWWLEGSSIRFDVRLNEAADTIASLTVPVVR